MLVRVYHKYHDKPECAGEKEEEVWSLVGDGGVHVQGNDNPCQVKGDEFPRVSACPQVPGDYHLTKDPESRFQFGEEQFRGFSNGRNEGG